MREGELDMQPSSCAANAVFVNYIICQSSSWMDRQHGGNVSRPEEKKKYGLAYLSASLCRTDVEWLIPSGPLESGATTAGLKTYVHDACSVGTDRVLVSVSQCADVEDTHIQLVHACLCPDARSSLSIRHTLRSVSLSCFPGGCLTCFSPSQLSMVRRHESF